jgi:hypothetical protein
MLVLSELLEYLCVISYHVLSLLPGLGRTLVIFYVMLSFVEFGVNHVNWLMFCRIVSLGNPSRRMLMMVQDCTSTYYVLFLIMVVLASDPKDLFVKHVIMFITQII